ncbi:hypothetical protein GCM10022221_50350 [Actinocorallia aurea]
MMEGENEPTSEGPRSRLVDSGVARRVLVSTFLGAFAYAMAVIVDDAKGTNTSISALVLSVLIGGITFLVQLLVEFERRLDSMEGHGQRARRELSAALGEGFVALTGLIEDRFARFTEESRLLSDVRTSGVDDAVITGLLTNTVLLSRSAPRLVKAMAEDEITRASRFIRQVVNGEVAYLDGEDQDWLLGLTRNISRSLDATSTSVVDGVGLSFDGGFWMSDLGQRYLKAQEDAVEQRGVRIRRLFIMRDYAEFTGPDFLPIAQAQTKAGIQIRAIQHDQVPGPLRSSLIDFILFDGEIRYEAIPDPSAQGSFLKTLLTTEFGLVQERAHRFDRLWTLAGQQELEREEREGGPDDVLGEG